MRDFFNEAELEFNKTLAIPFQGLMKFEKQLPKDYSLFDTKKEESFAFRGMIVKYLFYERVALEQQLYKGEISEQELEDTCIATIISCIDLARKVGISFINK